MLARIKERSVGNRKLYLVGNCFRSGFRKVLVFFFQVFLFGSLF